VKKNVFLVVMVAAVSLLIGEIGARALPSSDPTYVASEAQSAFTTTTGYCGTTPADGTDSVFDVAAGLGFTAAEIAAIRYVKITNKNSVASDIEMGATMGGDEDATYDPIWPRGSIQYQIRRPERCGLQCGNIAFPWPTGPIDVKVYTVGVAGSYCVVFYS
jgi:hypothetical protein